MNAKTKPVALSTAAVAAAVAAPLAAAVQEQGTSGATAANCLPALGTLVLVKDPLGVLPNTETGQRFEAGVATPQRVTVHTRQRLQDGCLVLAD